MFENEFHISVLLTGHFRGQLSVTQEAALTAWLKSSADHQAYFDELKKAEVLREKLMKYDALRDKVKDEIWAGVSLRIDKDTRKNFSLWYRVASVAAVFIVMVAIALLFIKSEPDSNLKFAANDIAAGGNKAFIRLGNGKIIPLSSAKTGVVINAANLKYNDGTEVFLEDVKAGKEKGSRLNTITTPRGGQYQISLSDGTVVYLNAASSLQYPNTFDGGYRTVILKGEAYFEVSKDRSHPFIVKAVHQQVTVLGTHFNMNAYPDEPVTKTTLLEGSVKVSSHREEGQLPRNKEQLRDLILQPGQGATSDLAGLKVTRADIEADLAWKNGYFRFNDENLKSIMRKIARWYDIEVNYQGYENNDGFTGTISRSKNISQVLTMLEKTKGVHFKIEGRRITIMP